MAGRNGNPDSRIYGSGKKTGRPCTTPVIVTFGFGERGRVRVTVVRELFGAKKEWTVGPGANLRGANFRGVDLRSVEMTGADLTGAILNEADLAGARLDRAILRDAVLFRAGLAGVSAVGADFRGAILRECELHAADLSDAIIDEWECELAYGDNQTKLPEGRTVTIGAQPDDPDLCDLEWGGG